MLVRPQYMTAYLPRDQPGELLLLAMLRRPRWLALVFARAML